MLFFKSAGTKNGLLVIVHGKLSKVIIGLRFGYPFLISTDFSCRFGLFIFSLFSDVLVKMYQTIESFIRISVLNFLKKKSSATLFKTIVSMLSPSVPKAFLVRSNMHERSVS